MTQPKDGKYPDLSDVIEELGIDFKVEEKIVNEASSGTVYTFETHPFYSALHDYSDVDIGEGLEFPLLSEQLHAGSPHFNL